MPVHPTALIDPQAEVHPTASVGAYVVIDGPARIGAHCQIAPFAVILGNTEIGAGCRIHSHAVLGDIPQDRAFTEDESSCRIGEGCMIREGATVHRGTVPGSTTVVGDRCFLMTNSHVGHNCVLADEVTLISGALLGGYVQVGNRAVISGNAAVHQFVRIGELAMVSGMAKIVQDIPPFLMTDRDGAIVGVNSVGLRRAGIPAPDRMDIKAIYRQFYRTEMNRSQVIESLSENVVSETGRRLLQFLTAASKRGITKRSVRRRPSI